MGGRQGCSLGKAPSPRSWRSLLQPVLGAGLGPLCAVLHPQKTHWITARDPQQEKLETGMAAPSLNASSLPRPVLPGLCLPARTRGDLGKRGDMELEP